jgi:hypothetical protein
MMEMFYRSLDVLKVVMDASSFDECTLVVGDYAVQVGQ